MANITATTVVEASPERAWAKVGGFDDVAWIPGSKGCEVEGRGLGAVRTVALEGGATLREKLVSLDEEARRYTYTLLEAPMPLRDYMSTIEVTPEGDGARVTWSCTFDADDDKVDTLRAALDGLYQAAVSGLHATLR